MNRPDSRTMTLGHPIMATPIGLGGLVIVAVCIHGGAPMTGLVTAAMMAGTVRAVERRKAYLDWKRAWDAMDPDASGPRWKPGSRLGFALFPVLLIGGLMLSSAGRQTQAGIAALAVLLALGAAAIVGLYWLWWRFRTRHARRGADPVAVIAKPMLAVPTLPQAYAALPEHCRRILAPAAR